MAVKGHNLIGALLNLACYKNIYENLVFVNVIRYERYYILHIVSAIREADTWEDCELECAELCRLAGMESEWREADGKPFEAVLNEAAKKLNVEI